LQDLRIKGGGDTEMGRPNSCTEDGMAHGRSTIPAGKNIAFYNFAVPYLSGLDFFFENSKYTFF
jgi:hypothetical protein